MQVVSAFTAADVYVATAAIQRNMSFGRDVAGRGIIGHEVAVESIVRKLNLYVAAQSVDLAGLLAFARVDDHRLLFTDWHAHFLVGWSCGRSGPFSLISRRCGLWH